MKLALEQLGAHLAGAPLGAYLVSGDEPLLVGEACDAIRARARAAGYAERETFLIERGNAVWEAIRESAHSPSLFAPRRVLEIRLPGGKPGTSGAQVLGELLALCGEELLVLVVTGRLDRDAQSAAWVRAFSERGAWLPVWPVERSRLAGWLRARLGAAGLGADEEALALLAEQCEGNLLAARQEIDKLALLLPGGSRVGAKDVLASSADHARFDVFELGQAVRERDAGRALRILAGLRAEGGEPVLVLWSLVRELRALESAAAQPNPAMRRRFARLAVRAGHADRLAKGQRVGDPWDELALLAAELAGTTALRWTAAAARE